MTPSEIAEVRKAAGRTGYYSAEEAAAAQYGGPSAKLILLGAFTDYLMRRPGGVWMTTTKTGCIVDSVDEELHVHPNPIVALARAVNATEDTP